MEARINMYKADWEKATQAERQARQEVLKLTFQNDELSERHRFMERKYLQLVQRVGASAEDLEAVEIMMANDLKASKHGQGPVAKDRIPSRHEGKRQDILNAESNTNYYLFGDNKADGAKAKASEQKTKIIENLEFDQEIQPPAGNMFYKQNSDPRDGQRAQVASVNSNGAALLQVNDSGDLLKKLIDNI